jgi:predicted nuclease of predicted toxin-antitoxin system
MRGHEADHVVDLAMEAASDSEIWEKALSTGAAILTKDEDFAIRTVCEASGPCIVWIRIGNCSNAALRQWLTPFLPAIEASAQAGEKLIEVV